METDRDPVGGLEGTLEILGRIPTASNATFLASIGETQVIYKPSEGERPLWDFPDGDLAQREVAAYLVSLASGWDIVPLTWLRDGPLGIGMVQLWKEPDAEQAAVDIVFAEEIPDAGWRAVFEGLDENEKDVTLIHEDSTALRQMAVFDAVVNNADRKGAHILEMPAGHRHGVDLPRRAQAADRAVGLGRRAPQRRRARRNLKDAGRGV